MKRNGRSGFDDATDLVIDRNAERVFALGVKVVCSEAIDTVNESLV